MSKHHIPCPQCHGKGHIPLPAELSRTLRRLQALGRPARSTDLLEKGITPNAICNRLVRLQLARLIQPASKEGKFQLWEVSY